MRKYKKDEIKKVENCLLNKKKPTDHLEKSFLVLNIKEKNGKIVFENDLEYVKEQLLELYKDGIRCSENIPRPENFFHRSEKNILQVIDMDEKLVKNALVEIEEILDNNFKEIKRINFVFKDFEHLFEETEKISKILSEETIKKEILLKYYQDYTKMEKDIIYNVPQNIYMNLVKINCTSLKNSFLEIVSGLKSKIMDRVQSEIFKLNKKIANELKISSDSISMKVDSSVEKLIQIEDNINNFKKIKYWEIVKDFDSILDWFEEFYLIGSKLNQEILKEIWDTKNKISKSREELKNEEARIMKERIRLEENSKKDKEAINNLLKLCKNQIDILKTQGLKYQLQKVLKSLKEILKKYEEGEKKVEIINNEEKKLKKVKSDFLAFKETGRILRIFEDLWTMIDEWEKEKIKWETISIFQLDIENIDETITLKTKKFSKILKEFTIMELDKLSETEEDENIKNPYILAKDMLKSIKVFKEDIIVLKSICQKGLKDRHWTNINNLLAENNIQVILNPTNNYYIKNLKESGIKNLKIEIEDIANIAAKEYTNEKTLDLIEEEWEKKQMPLEDFKIPNSYIITSNQLDEIQTTLEEHIIKIQTMKGSQHAQVYKERIVRIEKNLILIEDTFDVWLKVQTLWIYLEPIFTSEDIMKSLPKEGSRFRDINKEFLEFMNMRKCQTNIIDLTMDPTLLKKLGNLLKGLELIDKNLENYLDKKRSQFPRFYFLSSDSLIDIISQSKNPRQIQKYIKILFEGINELKFSDEEEIEGMISSEGEYIHFEQKIVPKYYKGLVERWLTYLEEIMTYEVKKFILQSLNDYSNMPKEQFVLNRPGQAIVNVFMTVWTFETESTINDAGIEGLEDYLRETVSSISTMVSLFDQNLSKVDRCGLETCIVISVHNRDILKQLIKNNVESINDFEYEAQMRYYWEFNDQKKEVSDNEACVRIMNTNHGYKYEYLGNSARLVITPLTDRCYRTLCSAIYLYYGGAPEGPAGTGKTETVKDLAKALARMIVVFNCSDKMNFKSMERFLKGLACSGGWSCFDEFNRIELEVLSVIAQQLQKIQNALAENKTEFFFGGSLIKIKNTCNCFITMNPGYSGRSELPDNLKALFRSVAMMVPDYIMIAEIRLFSYGFKKAGELAVKIVTTYKLCSEQISPQKHYDYGMRAVNTTLKAAGNFKKSYPDEKEDLQVLRAIYQVNEAKFLSEDLHLFYSITNDLFLETNFIKQSNPSEEEKIKNIIINLNLQPDTYFLSKVNQLNETLNVRHGVMMVGSTYGGKTSALKVLKNFYKDISINVINPKAIDASYLYGFTDIVSNEWFDGVLTVRFKELIKLKDYIKKWMVFDGPVDAVWIENLNTVLDDNKKLCLSNGDVFYMAKNMNMIFEVEDLAEASPATISRCGMVYFENYKLGWFVLYKSWQKSLSKNLQDFDLEKMDVFFVTILKPLFSFIKNKKIQFIIKASEQQIVKTMLEIAFEHFKIFNDKKIYENMEFKERISFFDTIFIYSIIWSMGVIIKENNRKVFDSNLKKLINICDITVDEENRKLFRKIKIPDSGSLFDYKIILEERLIGDIKKKLLRWKRWSSFLDSNIKICETKSINEILIETEDTIKYKEFINNFINSKKHILICGPSGTGKTVFLYSILKQLDQEKKTFAKFCFSGQTSCSQLQENIENRVTKRPGKNKFGPPGNKEMIFFIDDMNMPKKEIYGAQPPIELLRQFIEVDGFYDLKEKKRPFKNISNIMLICSMTLHNSSNNVTPRFLRYFNILPFIEFNNEQMFRIFNSILTWHFSQGFEEKIQNKISKITNSVLDIYQMVKKSFLPLPSKIHYMFNLRDISKIIRGICASTKQLFTTPEQVFKLCAHEIWRVFGDRLNSEEDRLDLLNKILKPIFNKMSSKTFDQLFSNLDINNDNKVNSLVEMRELVFTNIAGNNYEEIKDKNRLLNIINKSLELYNEESDKPLDIVLFTFAVEHLLIINRIIQQEGGHALLIGTGGSGRSSLTRLASFISDFNYFVLSMSDSYTKDDWRDDLKLIIKSAGRKKDTVFLFNENQIREEYHIEDINNLLNNGEVPNLFNAEDKGEIMEIIKNFEGGNVIEAFNDEVKKYLHIVLCFSQIGDNFKEKVKMYPSIVNCCNIDWFFEWPEDALTSVAHFYLDNIPIKEEEIEKSIEIIKYFHYTTKEYCNKFRKELNRINYVTGNSFLEMLTQFKNLYYLKQKEVIGKKNTYKNGYEMIIESETKVEEMKETLKKLKPDLEKAKIDTQKVMEKVAIKKKEADKMQEILSKEEAEVAKKANESKMISDECQKQIDKIQPELDKARDIVEKINKKDFDDLKQYKQPPLPIKYALQCLCIILGTKVELKKDTKTFRMVPDWLLTSKKMLGEFDIKKLLDFDNEKQMDDSKNKKLVTLFTDPETSKYLELSTIEFSSPTAAGMFSWVEGQKKLYVVNKKLKPRRRALKEAINEYNRVNNILKEKSKKLININKKVDELNVELKEIKAKKKVLEIKYENCIVQTKRAHKLIDNLSDEKVRWKDIVIDLEKSVGNLIGGVLLSAGFLAYLGPFTGSFREEIITNWEEIIKEKEIVDPEDNFNFEKFLGNQIEIRNWVLNGLPGDFFSVCNGIIMKNSIRYPLFIDPQFQANKFIKNLKKKNKLLVLHLSQPDFFKKIDNAIRFGLSVLIENIKETLPTTLDTILLKQTFKNGNSLSIKLGDEIVDFNSDFELFITTKLSNPHYLPNISTKTKILNFMITEKGLKDQILGLLVIKENPSLENQRQNILVEGFNNRKQLNDLEVKILEILSLDKKKLLEDETALSVLTASKKKSKEVMEKQKIADKTEKEIETVRLNYVGISEKISKLFFSVNDLSRIDSMYEYSLMYFLDLVEESIENSKKSSIFKERLSNIYEHFMHMLYNNISRSIFVKDKLIFSFLILKRLKELEENNDIKNDLFRFLLTGVLSTPKNYRKKPDVEWINEKSWQELLQISLIDEKFENLPFHFENNLEEWEKITFVNNLDEFKIPNIFSNLLTDFDKLIIYKIFRPDKLVIEIKKYIKKNLGEKFVTPPQFDLDSIFTETSSRTPILFILTPGIDPFINLKKLSENFGIKLENVSLGQGQGPLAKRLIGEAMNEGSWIVLQNCHLAKKFMKPLEKECEKLKNKDISIHKNFRIWLTSYPTKTFPLSILQNSLKLTNEPPKGLKNNLTASLNSDIFKNNLFFTSGEKNSILYRLIFSLCFFHSLIQERKSFGSLGWNIPYEFTQSDLRISAKQIKVFLDKNNDIPLEALNYIISNCNYGGRVTDDKDRRLINTLLYQFLNRKMIKTKDYLIEPCIQEYSIPLFNNYKDILKFAENIPVDTNPGILGFHPNASITKDINQSNRFLNTILKTENNLSENNNINSSVKIIEDLIKEIPELFNEDEIKKNYPFKKEESMNTVLQQDTQKFNKLLTTIKKTLVDISMSLEGKKIFTSQLEEILKNILEGKVPQKWLSVSYPSLKPLASYLSNLKKRVEFFKTWIKKGKPNDFWISGFFFTQGFLTSVLQNYSRNKNIPIDKINFKVEVIDENYQVEEKPIDQVYIHGMFLEGASFDYEKMILTESTPRILYMKNFRLKLTPFMDPNKRDKELKEGVYQCPLYRTAERKGELLTTGHSTNFVTYVDLPTDVDRNKWIKRGVALLLELPF